MNILFDIDDTLYDQKEVFKKAWQASFNDRDEVTMEKIFVRSRALSSETFVAISEGKVSEDEMYIYRITKAMSEHGLGVSRLRAEQFQAAYLKAQSEIVLSETVKTMLTKLKNDHHRIGILSNGGSKFQRRKIKNLQLDQWFDDENTFISEEIGYEKPDEGAFAAVLDRWGVDAGDVLYVGDAYDHDIVGAASAGLQTLWMNRRHAPVPENELFLPDQTVYTEAELADVLCPKFNN